MDERLLTLLRCPFCGGSFTVEDNAALERTETRIESAVIWCECCAFPVVAGIPVLRADEATRGAMQALEAGRREDALHLLLGLDRARGDAFRALRARGDACTYRDAIAVLSPDPEGTYFIYRLSDPTFVMAEAVLHALAQEPSAFPGCILDLCGGSGHLTRVLTRLRPAHDVLLADMFFWKLWLARTFTAPTSHPVCCDANQPLPFARGACPTVVLSDAFPYIWQKRLLAEEMMRLTGPEGAVVMPHLHSSLGENFSAGMTLTPGSYHDLFVPLGPRLFSDDALLSRAVIGDGIDLARDVSAAELGEEPSFTLVASRNARLFRQFEPAGLPAVAGTLAVNPLYRMTRRDHATDLTLAFPTPEYEEEFGGCRRYLPETISVDADLTGRIDAVALGSRADELRRRRVLLDAPPLYC